MTTSPSPSYGTNATLSTAAPSGSGILDPYNCLSKKSAKYASECVEVYLANSGGTSLSEHFRIFMNLEVCWFNGNKLSRIENLENCFRIKQMYLQNNRLVSLNFLRNFKFINTLLASNNQIRNLEKQLELLTRLSFLKKCDLFENPVAEEPDYRLRLIYHVPQVELLDRQGVTLAQRERANETVPNMDKVSASKAEKAARKTFQLSVGERDMFREAKTIRAKRQQAEEDSFRSQTLTRSISLDVKLPNPRAVHANKERWLSPSACLKEELNRPTPWEKRDMAPLIERLAREVTNVAAEDDCELRHADVETLSRKLAEDGIEEVGRLLCRPDVFATMPASQEEFGKGRTKFSTPEISENATTHPLQKLMEDADATMPAKEVAEHLLTLEWRRHDDDHLDKRIGQLYEAARIADLNGDEEALATNRNLALRLEGVKTRKYEVGLKRQQETGPLRKSRSDVFAQSMLRPSRGLDETGRMVVKVAPENRMTSLGA